MAVLRERGDGDVGDVVRVDERLEDTPGGQGDLAREHPVAEESLAAVLHVEARAHERPIGADACSARSARCASGSSRPESRTTRRVPVPTASSASAAIASGAPGTARSGAYAT